MLGDIIIVYYIHPWTLSKIKFSKLCKNKQTKIPKEDLTVTSTNKFFRNGCEFVKKCLLDSRHTVRYTCSPYPWWNIQGGESTVHWQQPWSVCKIPGWHSVRQKFYQLGFIYCTWKIDFRQLFTNFCVFYTMWVYWWQRRSQYLQKF